jgi:hypothetical protein
LTRLPAAFFALILLAACTSAITPTPAPPTQTLAPTSRFSTHVGPVVRETLPPTWTQTPTPLPTFTATATPVTPTATATPAPSLADLCSSFTLEHAIANGQVFRWTDTLTMVIGTPLRAITDPESEALIPLTVRFLARNPLDGENLGVQLPGGQVAIMELPIYQLPEPGFYLWNAAVHGEGIGEQCAQGGWFAVLRTADDLAMLATATSAAATSVAGTAQAAATAAAQTATLDAAETSEATEMVE